MSYANSIFADPRLLKEAGDLTYDDRKIIKSNKKKWLIALSLRRGLLL
jgi:hypothetical protein